MVFNVRKAYFFGDTPSRRRLVQSVVEKTAKPEPNPEVLFRDGWFFSIVDTIDKRINGGLSSGVFFEVKTENRFQLHLVNVRCPDVNNVESTWFVASNAPFAVCKRSLYGVDSKIDKTRASYGLDGKLLQESVTLCEAVRFVEATMGEAVSKRLKTPP